MSTLHNDSSVRSHWQTFCCVNTLFQIQCSPSAVYFHEEARGDSEPSVGSVLFTLAPAEARAKVLLALWSNSSVEISGPLREKLDLRGCQNIYQQQMSSYLHTDQKEKLELRANARKLNSDITDLISADGVTAFISSADICCFSFVLVF